MVSAIKLAQWSPNKDLIACLTQDCQLHAYREYPSFQRIWSLSFQNEPTALCWHPDGVRLGLGHSNGSVSVIDAEDGRSAMQVRARLCVRAVRGAARVRFKAAPCRLPTPRAAALSMERCSAMHASFSQDTP